MSRAGDIFPGLKHRANFGAVAAPAMLALQAVSTAVSVASFAMQKSKNSSSRASETYGASCACQAPARQEPWCPFRQASANGKQAAYLYGAAVRGAPRASNRILAMKKGIRLGDPRATAAAQKLGDADQARRLVSRVARGDRRAASQIAEVFSQASSSVEAAEAAAMLEVWLTDPACLSAAEEMMDAQWDAYPDDWIVDEFSEAGLTTALIDAQLYNWPV